MYWAKTHPPAEFNLARSGVQMLSLRDLDIDPAELDVNGPNAYGYMALREAIAQRFSFDRAGVVLTQGTSFANHLVMAALLEPGDEVIVEHPTYEVLHKLPLLFHAKVKRLPRRFENRFQIDPAELQRLISEHTRLIVLTNSHNPSGVTLSPDILREVAILAERHGCHVLFDEVYLESYYGRRPSVAASLSEHFITTSSLTKAYGLDGLRCGWILCENRLAERLRRLNDFFGVAGAFIAEQLGAHIFPQLDGLAARHRTYCEKNYRAFRDFASRHPRLQWVDPGGGLIAFPKLLDGDADSFVDDVRKRYHVSLVPGRFFEMPQHFRIAWGVAEDTFAQALSRIASALR